jgi:anti-anti-sigma factor
MWSNPNPRLRVEPARGRIRVTFLGRRLAAADVDAIRAQLATAPGRPLLRLDLTRVEFLSAATLGSLILLRQAVRAAGGELALENLSPLIHEVFEVTGLVGLLGVRGRLARGVARAAV